MGWDAFGLPAENAALERGAQPKQWTYSNIAHMKSQLRELGCRYDWDRELATCHPSYYTWTQHLFLRLLHAGLAYQDQAMVNWDPVDQTVLADEQVDESGCSWRSGAPVERRSLTQWFLKITKFSKSLYDGLSDPVLEDWQDISKIQRHWIGQCDGYRVEMCVEARESRVNGQQTAGHSQEPIHRQNGGQQRQSFIRLWMARPELIHGISFIGVQQGHNLDCEKDKGQSVGSYRMLNVMAVCPLTHRRIPVIVSDDLPFHKHAEYYVGVPCVSECDANISRTCGFEAMCVLKDGRLVNSGELDGMSMEEGRAEVLRRLEEVNSGGYQTSARLRDWVISRQRYWGTPIPIIHCDQCGAVPVPEDQLPVTHPDITFSGKGVSPLMEAVDWLNCTCPRCGGAAKRETDTMDTFVDSSWYFLRFLDPHNTQQPFSHESQAAFMPVDVYVGGKEHAELHLLYARFLQHFLASEGVVDVKEPFSRLVMIGQVKSDSYRISSTGVYLSPHEVDFLVEPPVARDSGAALVVTSEKMSKSKKNGIDPQEVLEKFGTDTTRLLMLADFAPSSPRAWSSDTFPGNVMWQHRLWLTVGEFISVRRADPNSHLESLSTEEREHHRQELWQCRNNVVRRVTSSLGRYHAPSVAIKTMQTLTKALRRVPLTMMITAEFEEALAAQIIVLGPIVPHFASELWAGFCSVASSTTILKLPDLEPQSVDVPRRLLEQLTSEEALGLVSKEKGFCENLMGRTVAKANLKVTKGVGAQLFITYKVTNIAEVRERRKKLKAEKKEEKKRKRDCMNNKRSAEGI